MEQFLIFLTTFIIQFIIATEMNLISPLAPFLSEYFNIKDNMVVLFNIGYSAVGILVPFLGILADRHGKKRILSFSLIILTIGCLIAGISKHPILFAMGRILIGLGYFSLSGTNLSYVSEFISYENRGKASGILRIAFGLAIITSPIYATTLINRFNNLISVYFPLIILAVIAYILLLRLPETKKSEQIKINKQEFLDLLKDSKSRQIFISLFLLLTAPLMLMSFIGIHLFNNFNLSQVDVGLSYTVIAIGTLLGIIVSTAVSDKFGKLNMTRIFFGIMVFMQIPLLFVNSLPLVIIAATLFSFGLDGGWTSYQAFASEIVPEKRGTFMSLFYTVNALTVTFYSIAGSLIYGIGGFKVVVALGFVFSGIALIIMLKLQSND